MNNKIDFFNFFRDSSLGLVGMVAGLMVINESISYKTAIKYAVFAIIVGPITRIMITHYPTSDDLAHIAVVCAGLFGFFIFKGLMVLAVKFSTNPIRTIKDIKKQVKK